MLQYIDSAIGFAMIMLTVSLVIMVIVQVASSLLDLRGRNLVWAMEQLFNQISPATRSYTEERAKSTFSGWTRFFRARLTRITVAEEIAHAIANHPALAANANSLATAIRPDEIQDVLQAIKDGSGRKPFAELETQVQKQIDVLLQPVEGMKTDIQAVNSALSAIDQLVPAEKAADVKKILNAAVTATSSAAIEKVMAEVKTQAADKADAIAKTVQEEIQTATVLEQGVEKWFNTVMDHASTRFVKHNRIATLIIAICVTLFFRIDSVEAFKQVFSNPELRASLMNAADAARKQAEGIGSLNPDIKQLTDRLDSQELGVFNLVKWPHTNEAPQKTWTDLYYGFLFHLRGLILTVLLLSLGAPFWFGALKDLGSLRPTIAGKIEKEAAASTLTSA